MPDRDSSALRYDMPVDLASVTPHTRILRMIGRGKRVLDLGCATGSLAAALADADCTVVGVESDPDAAELAKAHCERVFLADLETVDLHTLDLGAPFDVVVAADVLEHLRDPAAVLRGLLGLFAPQGYLLTSIPNVAHGSIRLALLAGQFPYRDTGLLDHTHVRFFTRSSMLELLTDGGFTPAYVERQQLAPKDGEVVQGVALEQLPDAARGYIDADPEAMAYQYVSLSFPGSPAGGLPGVIGRLAAEAEQSVAFRAEQERRDRQSAAELEATRIELLTARDQLTRAGARLALADTRVAALDLQLSKFTELDAQRAVVENELRDAHARLQAIYRSRLWRLGLLYRAGLARVRGR